MSRVALRLGIEMVRLIGHQHDTTPVAAILKILDSHAVFARPVHLAVQRAQRGETNVDGSGIALSEIAHLANRDRQAVDADGIGKKVLAGRRIEKIGLGLLDDLRLVDEEQKVAIATRVEVEDKRCHQYGLPATGGHVEQQVRRVLTLPIVAHVIEKALQGIDLIWPKCRSQIVGDRLGQVDVENARFGERIELLCKRLRAHASVS